MKRLLMACLLLTACGNSEERTPLLVLAGAARDYLRPSAAPAAPDPNRIARAALERLQEPVTLAVLEDANAVAAMVPYGENAGVVTWTTIDSQTISLSGPRVVATRGLGADLMALENPGGARPVYHFLDAANDAYRVAPVCRATEDARERITLTSGEVVETRRVVETCKGDDASFTNLYWYESGGQVRRSRQWLGPKTGYVILDRLR